MSAAPGCTRCGWQPAGELWPSAGELGCDWIESYCIFGEGDSYGKPFRLYDDQQNFIYRWLEYCPRCWQWRYSHAVWGAASGSGKTQFVAAIAAMEFAGPASIAPQSSNVVVAAASYDQAGLLFSQCGIMLGGPERSVTEAPLRNFCEVYDNRVNFAGNRPGQITRVAAVAGTNEGGNPTLFLADEVHAWGETGSPKARLHSVISKSTTKRSLKCVVDGQEVDRGRGRIIDLSTAGFDVDSSFLGQLYLHGKRTLEDPALDPRLLFYWREAREGLDYEKPEDRATACRDASGAADVIWSVADRVAEWGRPSMPRHEWIRYYANAWVDLVEDSWLSDHPAAWGRCQGTWELNGDEQMVLAVDMSLKHDSTAVVEATMLEDERIAVTARIWNPGDGKVDHREVFEHIRSRSRELGDRLAAVTYDPRYFELAARTLEDEDDLVVIEFDQWTVMAQACGETYDRIIKGKLVHDGNKELSRHVRSAVRKQQERGFTLSKNKSRWKIDAAVALCMAVWILQQEAFSVDGTSVVNSRDTLQADRGQPGA